MADETVRGSAALIYKADAGPVSVAQAKQLVLDALPSEKSGAVYAEVDENGELVENGSLEVREQEGVQIYASFMGRDFVDVCKHLGVEPRLKYRPLFTDYTGADGQDETYTITHDEFVRFAGFYGVVVEVGSVQPRDNFHATRPTKKWTDEFKAEVRAYRDKHGLKKTAEHFGVSQATISRHVPAGKPKSKRLSDWPPRSTR